MPPMNPETLKRRWLREDEQKIDAAVAALLQHEHGRRLLWWLLEQGKVGQQPFTGNALTTAFGCGELNVGQRILDRVTSVSPEGYVELMKEMASVRKQRDDELELARGNNDDGGAEPGDGADEQ